MKVKKIMKKNKALLMIGVLLAITVFAAIAHLSIRKNVPESAIEVLAGEESQIVDIAELAYEQVTGIRVNGKGEEKEISTSGILLKSVLAEAGITEYAKVSVVADDAYSVDILAKEVTDNTKVYLIQEEGEERLRLIVFGDEDSKRSVSNVMQIIVE